jgi:hypothetical protein
MNGNAAKMAAADAKKQLLHFAIARLKPNVIYDLDIKNHWVHLASRPERGVSYKVLQALEKKNDVGINL